MTEQFKQQKLLNKMDCYFYSRDEKEIIHATKNSDHWILERLEVYPNRSEDIEVIEPKNYNYWLDQLVEGIEYPKKESTVLPPEIGKNYIIGEQVMSLEDIVPNRAMVFSLVKGSLDGFQVLSESDADTLGLTWKDGLITLSPEIKLREYNPNVIEFDPLNLCTYPRSTIKTYCTEIRYIILSLGGFKKTEEDRIIETPHGDLIDLEYFLITLGVRINRNISGIGETAKYNQGDSLEFSYITESFKGSRKLKDGDIIDTNGKIHLIVRLSNKNGHGISSVSLRNISPKELFRVTWDTAFSINRQKGRVKKERMMVCPSHEYKIFRKENSGFIFRIVDHVGRYKKLIEKM